MILIVAAMESEIADIIKYPHPKVKVIQTGVGKVNAASVLSFELAKNPYDAIYNLGLAGATKPFKPGDVVVIDKAKYHDFDLTMFGYALGQVPHLPEYFYSNNSLHNQLKTILNHALNGTLYTGDRFMTGLMHDHMVFDMEGAALYHVAHMHQIPIISIKVVSDVIGEKDHLENYTQFESQNGSKLLLQIYQHIVKGVI